MIPFLAHNPSLIMIARGVESPKAQGHATTKTVMKWVRAILISLLTNMYAIKVRRAIIMIVGTKIPLTLSAILAIGDFVLLASTTSLTTSDIVESFPIFSALYSIYPSIFRLPAITLSPTSFFLG